MRNLSPRMNGPERILLALAGAELDRVPEIGVNAINPLQPEYMDAVRIR